MTVTSLQRLEEEVLKMSTIILGVMVVWGEGNEEVVKVIAGLDEKVQRGLKGVIEEVSWMCHQRHKKVPRKLIIFRLGLVS